MTLSPSAAAWELKNTVDGDQRGCIDALRSVAPFVRVTYAPPVAGAWEILEVEAAEPPATPLTLYRRAETEYRNGIFWATTALAALLHTADRWGLQMHEAVFEAGDLVAEFVMLDRFGRTSGGELIVDAKRLRL